MITRIDALSDAHERLAGYAYVDAPGFPFHAPMGAEALSSAGFDALVAAWVEDYTLEDAIAAVPRPAQAWTPVEAGSFARIGELAGFPEAVAALAAPGAPGEAISDLTAAFCRVVISGPPVLMGPIHAVTPAAAVRTLLPYLPPTAATAVYGPLWHVGAAIVAGFVPPGGTPPAEPRPVPAASGVLARAAEHRDTHAVKFAEACVREHAIRPDPAYLLAAQHVLDTLPPW